MPRISSFFGIVIEMYFGDHPPPHFHARYGGEKADSRELFERVRVNPESHTVEWPGEVDLDPEVLYGRFEPASGARLQRRTIREPQHAN